MGPNLGVAGNCSREDKCLLWVFREIITDLSPDNLKPAINHTVSIS